MIELQGPFNNEHIGVERLSNMIFSLLNDEERQAYVDFMQGTDKNKYMVDMYLPKGCEKLKMPAATIIEYKRIVIFGALPILRLHALALKQKFPKAQVWLIYQISNVSEQLIKQVSRSNFSVLRFDEIRKLITSEKEPSYNRGELLNKARYAFQEQDAVLFLGAGVCQSAGLPSWEGLLKNIYTQISNENYPKYSKIKKDCGDSCIIIAKYLQTTYNSIENTADKLRFNQLVHSALYSSADESKASSPLIKAISSLIQSKNVESVINYNYDNLIELQMEGQTVHVCSITKGNRAINHYIPIYHVHGLLEKDGGSSGSSEIVLSEDEYHAMYNDAYIWSTIEQLHALNNKHCFFIGLSMNDPNLRRLLDASIKDSDQTAYHYAFLKEPSKRSKYYEMDKRIKSEILRKYGINVIWYKKHDELPSILMKLLPETPPRVESSMSSYSIPLS